MTKIFKLEVSREVVYWESARIEIEANSLEEAKAIALSDAKEGYIDVDAFDHDDYPKINYEVFEDDFDE
jgi:hypothetical protein